MKKKIISCCLAVALVVVAVAGGSLAYFTAKDDATNNFTVGNAQIDLVEEDWDAELQANQDVHKNLYPGQTITKDPKVKNIGNNPVYIRVKVEDATKLNVKFNEFGSDWKEHYGYYYFMKEVIAGAETTELFQSFTIPTSTENDLEGIERDINVFAEAVQSQGAPDNVLESAANLDAWFNTCQTK